MSDDPVHSLLALAAVTGFLHTLAGPDHYLPFVVMSRSRSWSWVRTLVITFVCGLGHVLGSVLLGGIGIVAGVAIFRLESIESVRGDLAAWLMLVFGLVYTGWALRAAARRREHEHSHTHNGGVVHSHTHAHHASHVHVHEKAARPQSITPWVLFTIFVFGPCEVLIPQLMYPAATGRPGAVVAVVTVFGLTTIATMLGMVVLLTFGLRRFRLGWLERNTHVVAGVTVTACGLLILLGLF